MLGNTSITFFFALLFIIILENAESFGKLPSSACDLFTSKPVPYPTPTPINLITEQAKKVHVNSSLIIVNGIFNLLTATNTGHIFQVFSNPFQRTSIQTYGGVLCGKTYYYYKVIFFFSRNTKLSSYTQINGKGAPITLSIIYYNKDYGSFEESLKHRDGLVIQDFLLGFKKEDNPGFAVFESQFYKLIEPGSTLTVPSFLAYAAFNEIADIHGYYTYYGSYKNFETGKIFPCGIVILADRIVTAISEAQFNRTFGQLKNLQEGKLDSRQKIQKTGKRLIARPDGGIKGEFRLI